MGHGNEPAPETIAEVLLDLAATRGADKTICPSEVARALSGPHPDDWSPLMQPVRRVAINLMKAGRIVILRKGRPVDPDDFRGVYRIGLPDGEPKDLTSPEDPTGVDDQGRGNSASV